MRVDCRERWATAAHDRLQYESFFTCFAYPIQFLLLFYLLTTGIFHRGLHCFRLLLFFHFFRLECQKRKIPYLRPASQRAPCPSSWQPWARIYPPAPSRACPCRTWINYEFSQRWRFCVSALAYAAVGKCWIMWCARPDPEYTNLFYTRHHPKFKSIFENFRECNFFKP